MSPLEELYLVLAAIYLADCLHWVRCDAQVFRARWKRFELQQGGALFGNDLAGLNLAWPLPPLGTIYVCDAPLRLPAASGVLRVDGRRLLDGELELARASSPRQADAWAEELSGQALERRERRRYDTRWIAERRAAADAARARVLPWAHAQLLLCFVLAPIAIEPFGLVRLLPWLLAVLFAVQTCGLLAFRRAHERLWPGERGLLRGELLFLALSPPGLMRAADLLTRDLFVGCEPLAVACVLLERAGFEREAARRLRAARHSAHAPAEPERLRALERFLCEQGLDPERLDAPPERLAADCLCYCPRCQTQFVIPAGSCERCSGLALVPFGSPGEQSTEAQPGRASGP